MVKFKTIRNFPMLHLIRDAMSKKVLATYAYDAIAKAITVCLPYPTGCRLQHLWPEPLFNGGQGSAFCPNNERVSVPPPSVVMLVAKTVSIMFGGAASDLARFHSNISLQRIIPREQVNCYDS